MNKVERYFLFAVLLGFCIQIATGQSESPGTGTAEIDALPLDEIRTFTEVFAKVKNDYVVEIDDKKLLENAIRGMLEGLDPHSAYLDKESYKELQEGTTGEFGGLGIEVGMENGFIKVIAPIDDTPAQRAGIQSGDLITRLDDTPVKGMSLDDAVSLMRGKPGTDITLTVMRENEDKPLVFTITRDIITVQSVKSRTLEPGFGYIRISHFQAHTAEDMQRNMDSLRKENNDALKGLILDLRNNPGGVLNAAVDVADQFLDKGLIVYTEGRIKDSRLKFNAKPADLLNQSPLVVLVNSGSASASEIVAGALQDHKRAVIMGERTFGKGSVQTILPMANEAALKLTTARYYTPSGRSIQAEGIIPDIVIENISLANIEKDSAHIIKEADLSGHLENDNGSPVADDANKQKEEEIPLSVKDYQLYEALNVLKGLVLQQKKLG